MKGSRAKVLLAFGATCLASAVLASGAMAHDKHRERGKVKIATTNALKVEVRGLITALTPATADVPGTPVVPGTPGSITVTAAPGTAGFAWTCIVPVGIDVSAFAQNSRVKAVCRSTATGLVLTKLRHKDKGDKVKIEARGTVAAGYTGAVGSLVGVNVVVTGVTDPITCGITDRTKIKGAPIAAGDTVKVECKSKNGAIVAKKIKKKVAKVEAKGALTLGTGTVTVGTVVCAIPLGMTLPAGAVNGAIVEIKCLGTPPVLATIELEDDDD